MLKNIDFSRCPVGGGSRIAIPPHLPKHLPLHWFKIGPRPSFGLFLRQVTGLSFENVSLGFLHSDERPAIFLQNATGVRFLQLRSMRGPDSNYDIAVGLNVSGLCVEKSPGIVQKNVE